MNRNNTVYILLKKLMQDALGENEQILLNDRPAVKRQMLGQWENAPDASRSDQVDGMRMWYHIRKGIEYRNTGKIRFYKVYSIVASILLLLAVGGMTYFLWEKKNNPSIYIVSCGLRNMQSVSLPDGTEVQLGAGSKLTYPSAFRGKNREVRLDGQAFFDVYKNPYKPFIVHTSDIDIEALGTAFEVFSYERENKVEAVLLNGKIRIGINDSSDNQMKFILSPNEKIIYDKQAGLASIVPVDADKYTSWRKQKMLDFENEKLSMIIPRLEQWYGCKILCPQDMADKYRFTFKVRDESLERILFMIGESSPGRYHKTNNGIYELIFK